MKKNQIYIGTIENVKFPNKGVISASYPAGMNEDGAYFPASSQPETDCPVTVKNAIPGQKI